MRPCFVCSMRNSAKYFIIYFINKVSFIANFHILNFCLGHKNNICAATSKRCLKQPTLLYTLLSISGDNNEQITQRRRTVGKAYSASSLNANLLAICFQTRVDYYNNINIKQHSKTCFFDWD